MKIKKGGAAIVAHFLFVLLPLYFVSVSLCTLFFVFHKHFFDISMFEKPECKHWMSELRIIPYEKTLPDADADAVLKIHVD